MTEKQQKRIERLRGMIARGDFDAAQALLGRDLTLSPRQKADMRSELSAARSAARKNRTPAERQADRLERFWGLIDSGDLDEADALLGRDKTLTQRQRSTIQREISEARAEREGPGDGDETQSQSDAGLAALPVSHLSIRVPWREVGSLLSSRPRDVVHEHPFSRIPKLHNVYEPTTQTLPAYSLEASPSRWVRRPEAAKLSERWGIDYNERYEVAADHDLALKRRTVWVQHYRNQVAMLDAFFSALSPTRSLVFIYTNDAPALGEVAADSPILLGVGRVTGVGPAVEWSRSSGAIQRNLLWGRWIGHSLRPDGVDGVVLPYSQLLAQHTETSDVWSGLVAAVPRKHNAEFSNLAELVSDEAAVAALDQIRAVTDGLGDLIDGPWSERSEWLADRAAELRSEDEVQAESILQAIKDLAKRLVE